MRHSPVFYIHIHVCTRTRIFVSDPTRVCLPLSHTKRSSSYSSLPTSTTSAVGGVGRIMADARPAEF